jgi:FkbM family methyltransferase
MTLLRVVSGDVRRIKDNRMKLTLFDHNGLNLLVRDGPSLFAERDIVREIQREYPWDFFFETAIDIGAHIGAWTCQAKRVNPYARIVACEVDPETYSVLEINANGLEGVTLVHGRAGYGKGQYGLLRVPHNTGSTTTYPVGANWDDHSPLLAPDRVTLEDLMMAGTFDRVDVLKLDCEGAEIDLLQHAHADTLSCIGRVVGEIHTTPQSFETQTNSRLQRAGFEVQYRPHPGDPNLFYLHAWREI